MDNKNEDEQTPLHVAAKNGKIRILKYILSQVRSCAVLSRH